MDLFAGLITAARNDQNAIHIVHHKTGKQVWHPLEETKDGVRTVFYAEAEAVLAKLPRRDIPMIVRGNSVSYAAQP